MISSLFGLLFVSSMFLAEPVAGLEKRLATTALTQMTCRTYLTTKSTTATTSTASLVLNLKPIVLYTKTPSTTQTPAATTTTTTTTLTASTTASVVTDTFTTTTTIIVSTTETDTTTISQTQTSTVTSTAAVSTSTVPVPDGFIYPTPTPGGKKRGLSPAVQAYDLVKRSSESLEVRAAAVVPPRCKGGQSKYPYKVACTQIIESIKPVTITLTAKKTTTITATTPTSTVTASTTTTMTIYEPDASVTSTVSGTDTVTSTMSVTMTQSQTVTSTVTYQPTSTYYAQCGAQNQVSTDPSGSQLTLVDEIGTRNQVFSTTDAYSCCAACATTANCAGSNWIPSLGSLSCELVIYDSCPANQGQLADRYHTDNQHPATFSNGNCGYFLYVSG